MYKPFGFTAGEQGFSIAQFCHIENFAQFFEKHLAKFVEFALLENNKFSKMFPIPLSRNH